MRNAKRRVARKSIGGKKPAKKKAAKPAAAAFAPDGVKSPDAPAEWPFGTQPQQAEPPADPESDEPIVNGDTPLDFLLSVVKESRLKLNVRMQAAALAAPFVHAKPAPLGKKEQRQEAAKTTSSRFKATAAPPRLVHSKR